MITFTRQPKMNSPVRGHHLGSYFKFQPNMIKDCFNIKCKTGDWKKPIVFAEDDIFCIKILKRDL